MKKNLVLFLYLFFSLFFITQKIHAIFYNASPYTQSFGTSAYATHWSPNGLYLAVGGTNFPADVTIYSWTGTYLIQKATELFGNGVKTIDWSPDGKYLAVGGNNPGQNLGVYKWNGTSLTLTASKYHGTEVRATAWSPNGNYLAVGGDWGPYDLAIYNWDGISSLSTTPTTRPHGTGAGTGVNAIAWAPDGTKLAVGGNYGNQDLILYSWNGTTLAHKNPPKDHGTEVKALAWTSTGSWLAVGGNNNTNDVIIYTSSGPNSLTLTTSISFEAKANTLAWSFDDKYLTVGGDYGSSDVVTYEWNGSTLSKIYPSQTNFGNAAYSVSLSPYSDYLAVGGDNNSSSLKVYGVHEYLNGTKNNVTLTSHYLFSHSSYALGYVNFTNGCTVLPGQTLKLALLTPFSGGLDLRTSGILQLEDDLYFDANVTLSSGGFISGQNHAIYLENNLHIPDNSVIHIASDTIIDGAGHDLILGRWSQIFIDTNITLTLRNLRLKNTLNNQGFPLIKCAAQNSKLALDNTEISPKNDFYFNEGQLYIHNDVIFTGTSQFIYTSSQPSYIAPNSMFTFEPNTTFFYDTVSSYTKATYLASGTRNYHQDNNLLINMQNSSSALYLDGCTIHVSHTGLRLAKGQIFFDNNVTLENNTTPSFSSLSDALDSKNFGNYARSVSWSPDGKYLAVAGDNGSTDVIVYQWNGTNLIDPGASAKKSFGSDAYYVSWSPDGKYLAAVGYNGSSTVVVYQWDGTNLIDLGTNAKKVFGNSAYSVSWSPDGKYLAVGGPNGTTDVIVYQWYGTSLIDLGAGAKKDFGIVANSASWSPDGKYLAVGGQNGTTDVIVYQWDGTNLIDLGAGAKKDFGSAAYSVSWNPDGKYLAVGGPNGTTDIIVYQWDGTSLIDLGAGAKKDFVAGLAYSVSWSPDGKYLAVGSSNQTTEIIVYQWDGTNLIDLGAGAKKEFGDYALSISWSPDGKYLAVGGQNGATDVSVYQLIENTLTYNPAYNQSLFFGNSALGKNYDLNFNMLNGAQIIKNGAIKYDNFN